MQEMKPIKEGKVREIYDNGDSLIMVATDRISCFDVILNNVFVVPVHILDASIFNIIDLNECKSKDRIIYDTSGCGKRC